MDQYDGDFSEFTILQQIEMCREKVTTKCGKKNVTILCEKLVDLLVYNKIGEIVHEKLKGNEKPNLNDIYEHLKTVPFTLTPSLHYARRNPYLHN